MFGDFLPNLIGFDNKDTSPGIQISLSKNELISYKFCFGHLKRSSSKFYVVHIRISLSKLCSNFLNKLIQVMLYSSKFYSDHLKRAHLSFVHIILKKLIQIMLWSSKFCSDHLGMSSSKLCSNHPKRTHPTSVHIIRHKKNRQKGN